jgi:DNA repair exonuclease SbcCD ATPase subunit
MRQRTAKTLESRKRQPTRRPAAAGLVGKTQIARTKVGKGGAVPVAQEKVSPVETLQKAPGGADGQGGENLDKVREILFGSQARDYEKRFARLEERLLRETAEAREEVRRRSEALESYVRGEFESLTDRLKSERSERSEAVKELSRELKDLTKAFERKVAQLDDQAVKNQRELRQQILDQSKTLADDIRRRAEELTAALQRESAELRGEKADRAALAALFTEMALRLNQEFKLPGGE